MSRTPPPAGFTLTPPQAGTRRYHFWYHPGSEASREGCELIELIGFSDQFIQAKARGEVKKWYLVPSGTKSWYQTFGCNTNEKSFLVPLVPFLH